MKLKDILAISGKSGLYKFISQGRNGIIVESFTDNKRMIVHSTTKVSALEDIAIYTDTEEVPLKEVFTKIYEKEDGKGTIDHKSGNDNLKKLFEEVLPNYDKERVYVSDIKKVISWYNTLIALNLLDPADSDDEDEKVDEESNKGEENVEEKEEKNDSSEE